ncbi:pyridoxal phosphate-dependent aminotransferase [Oceanispirochaeta crateris]|nr:histidinol-phosphate transaminase [Oceanispirochaeta crateris]
MGSEHGGLNYSELRKLGISPDDVLDFSVSINPDPLPDSVLEDIRNSCIIRYPDSDSGLLKNSIAAYNNIETDSILVVNGTSQGMFLIVSSLLKENQCVAIVEPTYSEYYDACRLKTDNIISVRMTPQESFRISTSRILETVQSKKPALLWLCSPNNPTGSYLNEEDFETIRKACVQEGTLLILDEAYVCFVQEKKRYNPLREGVIVLRSMTKDFSIPGLRLGYILSSPTIIQRIKKWQPEWSISAPAQVAGVAGFRELDYFKNSWRKTTERRDFLKKNLEDLGLTVYDSCSNFFLVEVDDAEALKTHLWKDLILVRDCSSFSLVNTIRIGIRTDEDNHKLIQSFKSYLKK